MMQYKILENVDEKDKNDNLSSLPPKDRFALLGKFKLS